MATLINRNETNVFVNNSGLVSSIPPPFLYVYTQVWPSGGSLFIVWPSGGLKLTSLAWNSSDCALDLSQILYHSHRRVKNFHSTVFIVFIVTVRVFMCVYVSSCVFMCVHVCLFMWPITFKWMKVQLQSIEILIKFEVKMQWCWCDIL